ncbi:hypothetical protein [Lacticaseibacillus daqingensis]|uniref:hypothetical protein n=1 Tax=Lacticaseibacillus daqingensis TaxID=2486014 RepID=UPI001CDB726B|nr:hypothetical protein [Lacticaseibacillus daqingensis]
MMDDLKQKEQARRRAAWTQYTALAVDAGIIALFAGQALGVAGMTMGTTTQYGLIALLWINLIVIGLNAPQFQALVKPLRRNNQKRQVRIGLVLIAVAVVAALDPRHTLNPWLLGLLICGAVILLWRTSKNRSDR